MARQKDAAAFAENCNIQILRFVKGTLRRLFGVFGGLKFKLGLRMTIFAADMFHP